MRLFRFAVILVTFLSGVCVRAEEPFLKKGDVIALVGGEDMVACSEYGYLELLLTRALPDYRLKFRNLAWEGDTVFEQPRQLNFPTWEQQLEKIGATVVICQFGQMESLAGKEKLPEFIAAYEKLLERFSGGGKRRIVVLSSTGVGPNNPGRPILTSVNRLELNRDVSAWTAVVRDLAGKQRAEFIDTAELGDSIHPLWRDGLHLSDEGHQAVAATVSSKLCSTPVLGQLFVVHLASVAPLRQLIVAKNRLWFDYWRPQNWAFLNGDRTTQPSSRDHRDPNVRWFPAEMEQFLPLIAAKEEEIWKLAGELK